MSMIIDFSKYKTMRESQAILANRLDTVKDNQLDNLLTILKELNKNHTKEIDSQTKSMCEPITSHNNADYKSNAEIIPFPYH